MRTKVPPRRLELLRTIELFHGMRDRELETVDALVDDIEVDAGEELTQEGRSGRESFLVIEGEAEVSIGGKPVATVGPGSFFGEMAMLDLKPRVATVVSTTPMHLLVISPSRFDAFVSQPQIAVRMLRTVVERLREASASAE